MAALLGIQAQGTGKYNYLVDGTVIPAGAPVLRNFVNHEGELYAQDTWKVTRNLTVTAGLRLSLEPPVYEANGQQASTNIPIADWLGHAHESGRPGPLAKRRRAHHVLRRRQPERASDVSVAQQLGAAPGHRLLAEGR